MSHEGIRIVNAEQARREDMEHEQMPSDAVTPKKVRVMKTEGTGVEIDWRDGHRSFWSFAWLRHGCPCATCVEERQKSGRRAGEPKPRPAMLLPMYEAPPQPVEVTPVGRYA